MALQTNHPQTGFSYAAQVVLAILNVLAGMLMLSYPFATATVLASTLGWFLLFAAFLQILFAFTRMDSRNIVWAALGALLYGFAAIGLIAGPISGAITLTALVGLSLLLRAVFELVSALQLRAAKDRTWLLLDGGVTLLLSIMILASWPTSTLWTLGTLLGVSVLTSGLARLAVAVTSRKPAA